MCKTCSQEIQGFYVEKIMEAKDTFDAILDREDDLFWNSKLAEEEIEWRLTNGEAYQNNHEDKRKIQNSNSKKDDIPIINTQKVYEKVTKKIIGQDEAVKAVLSTIIGNFVAATSYTKSNIFIIGGTGNGKSETVKQIAKELGIPYVLEDASKYTQEGYVGESVENAVVKLLNEAGKDIKKAERGIIIFDEIDKKTSSGDTAGVATTNVQDSMLKMLEGATFQTTVGKINTEHITFILIGACERAFEARKKRISGSGTIGFSNSVPANSEVKNPKFIPEDLIEAGFKSELIGRIDLIQEFKAMDIEMATNIINNSDISILDLKIKDLNNLGFEIEMDRQKIVKNIANRAIELKTGARAIRQIVIEMFTKIYSDIMIDGEKSKDKKRCKISPEIVYDNTKYKFM